MASTFLSRIIGLVRVKYIVWLFGRGMEADAFNAAFVLPDMISYFLVGGAASVSFVTILTRYREQGRDQEGDRSLSVILTTMYLVLGAALLLAEVFAPAYIHWWFNGFDARKAAVCVTLTRILLPAQLFFFTGGVFGAVLMVRKQFSAQAFAPLIYGLGTIVGGLLMVHTIGVASLAIGTVAGAFFGPFLLNAVFARRAGSHYHMILDWRDPGLREWVRLSLPLMAGVSLVTADNWIIGHFASRVGGAVSLMSYAKQIFSAPMSMLAQAAGAASMPFFATMWSQQRRYEFATGVADSVSRVASLSLLAASVMIALGHPAIDLVFSGGRFSHADAALCASYFAVFAFSLFLWSAQSIYARAFYAAGLTLAPMLAATAVTAVSLPVYNALYGLYGPTGLAIASDLGILVADRDRRPAAPPAPHGLAGKPRLRRDGPLPARCMLQRTRCLDGGLDGRLSRGAFARRCFAAALAAGRSHPARRRNRPLAGNGQMDSGKMRLGAAQGGDEAAGARIESSSNRRIHNSPRRPRCRVETNAETPPPMQRRFERNQPRVRYCCIGLCGSSACAPPPPGLFSGLRMSMPPLKNAPSSMLMRAAVTSPLSEPSARMSTRSEAFTLPRILPSTTISRAVMLAATCPLRPTVTRFPGRLMLPSTLPSMNSDSEPLISPLITSPLPMVAWSPVAVTGARPVPPSEAIAGAAGREGSGLRLGAADPA